MNRINYTILALALFFFSACSNQPSGYTSASEEEKEEHAHTEDIELTETQLNTVDITLGSMEQKEMGSTIRANGKLKLNPQDRAEVTSLIGGIVRKIEVVEGQAVQKGQPVAYIENTEVVEMQKNYLIACKETETALLEWKRQKELSAQGAGVEKTLQQASANYQTAKARQTGLYHQLLQIGISPQQTSCGRIIRQIPVKAPISGTVSKISVSSGSYADISTPLMSITNNKAVYCSLNVFERDIERIALGHKVDVVITNNPQLQLQGTVYKINSTMDPITKTFEVYIRLQNKSNRNKLSPDMGVTGSIYTGKKQVSALPDEAVVDADGKNYVFVLENKTKSKKETTFHFKRIEVIKGVSDMGYTQVEFVRPLTQEQTFVKRNAFYLASMTADHGEH